MNLFNQLFLSLLAHELVSHLNGGGETSASSNVSQLGIQGDGQWWKKKDPTDVMLVQLLTDKLNPEVTSASVPHPVLPKKVISHRNPGAEWD